MLVSFNYMLNLVFRLVYFEVYGDKQKKVLGVFEDSFETYTRCYRIISEIKEVISCRVAIFKTYTR